MLRRCLRVAIANDPAVIRKIGAASAARGAPLVLAALGVVFGDIATSPLYAIQAAFGGQGIEPTPENILGLLSLTFWALVIVVSLKYVVLIMRADNHGEGGIMSLVALVRGLSDGLSRATYISTLVLGLGGAAFFFGDAVITPAVSVISSVEGLQLAAPSLAPYIVPISAAILVGLFMLQRFGSAKVGQVFGPIMALWLITIGVLGATWLVRKPEIASALDPIHGIHFFVRNGLRGFETLGAVVLVLTGAEALYADMGHFGVPPIRAAWFFLVLPCLLLNYFGQGALLLIDPSASALPFYKMVPTFLLIPMIALAAVATVIASQAVIAGTYSMAREAMLLGFLPRMLVEHTSQSVEGQVYLPVINGLLFVAVMFATLLFQSSDALAAAYGIAVSGTMMATTVLVLIVARRMWKWPLAALFVTGATLLCIDAAFLGANLVKIRSGGWFPLVIGLAMFVIMVSWRRGRKLVIEHLNRDPIDLPQFIASVLRSQPHRVEGTAIFLTAREQGVPAALLHNLKLNQVLHTVNVLLTVEILNIPMVSSSQRTSFVDLGDGFYRVIVRFGFADATDVPGAFENLSIPGVSFEPMRTSYFLSRGKVVPVKLAGMPLWQAHLFAFMSRNSLAPTEHFQLPENGLIEIGTRIDV